LQHLQRKGQKINHHDFGCSYKLILELQFYDVTGLHDEQLHVCQNDELCKGYSLGKSM
jgi:hypothetical protein